MKYEQATSELTAHRSVEELCCLSEEELSNAGLDAQTLEVVSLMVQQAQDLRRRRQAEGIAAAKAIGTRFGRPPIETPPNFEQILNEFDAKHISFKTALLLSGMGQNTFYSRRKQYRAEHQSQ